MQAAIGEEVVGRLRIVLEIEVGLRGVGTRRHAVERQAVLDADRQPVGRPVPRQAADVEGERQMAAHVLAEVLAVEPDPGVVNRRTEAQANPAAAPARVEVEVGLVPGGPEVIARVVEQVVPATGHRDLARRRQAGREPPVGLAPVGGIKLEAPETGEVARRAGRALVRIEQAGVAAAHTGPRLGGRGRARHRRRSRGHKAQGPHRLPARERGTRAHVVGHIVLPRG